MWLAERDACSEVRATIRMSRSSLYTAARRRPEGIPPRREVIGCAVRRRGGAPGRPLHRSAPASARIREFQIARRIVCVSGASARSERPRAALGPSLGIRANPRAVVCRARRAVGSRSLPRRGAGGYAQYARVRIASVGAGVRRLIAYLYPAISDFFHTQPHCAARRTALFSPPSRVRRHP